MSERQSVSLSSRESVSYLAIAPSVVVNRQLNAMSLKLEVVVGADLRGTVKSGGVRFLSFPASWS